MARLRARNRRIRVSFADGAENFAFATTFRPILGPIHFLNTRVPGNVYPALSRPAHEPPSSAEIINDCSYTSTKRPRLLELSQRVAE